MYRQGHRGFAQPTYRIIPENYSGNAFRNDIDQDTAPEPTENTALIPVQNPPNPPEVPPTPPEKNILSGVKHLASDTSLLFLVLLILAAGGGEKDDGALFMILILLLL